MTHSPRRVGELTFSEIFLLWSLRQPASRFHSGDEALRREVETAFGPAGLNTAWAAFGTLQSGLAGRRAQLGGLHTEEVSRFEETLLSALVLAHDRQGAALARLMRALFDLPTARQCGLAFFRLAEAFEAAGHDMPASGQPAPARAPTEARDEPRREVRTVPGVMPHGERLLLTAFRIWIAAYRQARDPRIALARFLEDNDAAGVASGLDRFLTLASDEARRQIEIHAPLCRGLSEDEARMLTAVGRLQKAEDASASALLVDWLRAERVGLGLDLMKDIADALARHDLRLRSLGMTTDVGDPAAAVPATARLH